MRHRDRNSQDQCAQNDWNPRAAGAPRPAAVDGKRPSAPNTLFRGRRRADTSCRIGCQIGAVRKSRSCEMFGYLTVTSRTLFQDRT